MSNTELNKEILDILDNVIYWETCPKDYKVRIKAIKKQLTLTDVSNCNAKKDTNIENTILLISRKDGLTDVYDNSGCLGKGLDTQGINDLNIT